MKKIILLVLVTTIIVGFNKVENKKVVTETQLRFIKEKYKWNAEDLLIINFIHSSKNCFYDNNNNLKNSMKWWEKFYSTIDLNNVSNIYVYADKKRAKKIIDSETRFEDHEDFLLNNFFRIKKECCGILVINAIGEYEVHEGEYTEKQVVDFIQRLKR